MDPATWPKSSTPASSAGDSLSPNGTHRSAAQATLRQQRIKNAKVVTLPQLIQLKLAARRHQDFGDVVFLIRVHNLDESFLDHLHPSVHGDFIECLEEKRRDDEYEARE